MRGKWLLISGAGVLIIAGGLYLRHQKPAPAPATQPKPAFDAPDISLPATIQASTFVPVPVPVDGILEALAAGPGQDVYEGQLLGRVRNQGLATAEQHAAAELERSQERARSLESAFIAARLEAARARADAARVRSEYDRIERVYQRQQMLVREGATARLTFERAKKEFETAGLEFNGLDQIAKQAEERAANLQKDIDRARRALEESERELDQAKASAAAAEIHSPVDGFVVAVTKKEGEEVTPDIKDLFRIAVNLTLLEAVVEPEPPALARMRAGQEAQISFAELPDALPGRVKEIRNGSQVVVEFANPSSAVRPGHTAQVRIKLL